MQTIDALLRDSPAFSCLDVDMLPVIAGCASNVQYRENEVIFREGDAANTFLLVRHGTVALETFVPATGPMLIETVGPGELVGWSWLFAPYRWQFDARALSDVRATSFDGACLRTKCEEDPVLGYDVMQCFARVMIERLQWTRLRLLDVYGNVGAR
jgi:CRP/FNR family transcriptional regulator, cyclic AMP receptor protein